MNSFRGLVRRIAAWLRAKPKADRLVIAASTLMAVTILFALLRAQVVPRLR
jgi:hypothetical protein